MGESETNNPDTEPRAGPSRDLNTDPESIVELMDHQPDSASDVTLWGKNHFKQFCSKLGYTPKLTPAPRLVKATNQSLIGVQGFFRATLCSKSASRVSRIFVRSTDDNDLPHHQGSTSNCVA